MANSIFASSAPQEDRQICELMAARNLGTSECESILFLTGISATSPYYCPPSIRSRGLFRYLKERAIRLVSRIEKVPAISFENGDATTTAITPKRVSVPEDQHPLSMTTTPEPIEPSAVREEPSLSSPLSLGAGASTLFASLLSYQSTIADRLASILCFAQPQQHTSAQEQITPVQVVEDNEEKVQSPSPSVPFNHTPNENAIQRAAKLNEPTGYATSCRRTHIFDNLSTDSDLEASIESLPLLTPLQRAIAQARADGYHLHPRAPLCTSSTISPPLSPIMKHSPPGLTSLKQQRYILRSHQVSASDFFRKEASHRAAVAVRNSNRGILIGKKDWSMYEPSGLIMPDEENTRLRVVLCPSRIPVRLWKTEYRGPQDWFEVEERNSTGGPAVFKRNSHLRAELDLTPSRPLPPPPSPSPPLPSDPVPAYTPSPTTGEAPCGMFTEPGPVEEKILPPTPGADTNTPSLKTMTTETIPSAPEVVEEQPIIVPSTIVEAPSSTTLNQRTSSSRTPLMTLLRTLATSARRRRAQGSAASSNSGTITKPIIDQAVPLVPTPNVITLSKSSPIQRLKAAAFRARTASLTPSSEETNRLDAIKCAPVEQPHSVVRPKLTKLQTQLSGDLRPECLDPTLAETHRKALLNKYFGPSGSNHKHANAILYTTSPSRCSPISHDGVIVSKSPSCPAVVDEDMDEDEDDLIGATDIESSSDEDTLYTGESMEPAQDGGPSEGSKSVLYDSDAGNALVGKAAAVAAAWRSSSPPLSSKQRMQLMESMPLVAGAV